MNKLTSFINRSDKMSESCPRCDYPPDGYPILIDKTNYYWCYNCKRKYDKETLKPFVEPVAPYDIVKKIRELNKEQKDEAKRTYKSKKGAFGQTLPLEERDSGSKMKLFEKEYACGYCFDTGYIVGVNGKFKTDIRTGLKRIRCPRDCRIKT